jgi:hypothetical protein
MLGFILSKLNLLILVTSIFAIVSFFALGLGDITKVKEAGELATKSVEKAASIANSPASCESSYFPFPRQLRTAGSNFYYVVKISKGEIQREGNKINILIFAVYPREEVKKKFLSSSYVPKAIAADSFRTNSDIFLYGLDYRGSGYIGNISDGVLSPPNEIYIDPQAENPMNALVLVKEVQDGKKKFHVIGCEGTSCNAYKTQIGSLVHPGTSLNPEGGFLC